MKKNTYDTPEIEIESLNKELTDLKNLHASLSRKLAKKSLSSTLVEIINSKKIIEDVRNQKRAIVNKIEKLQPCLF